MIPRPWGRGTLVLALRRTHCSRLICFFGLDRDRLPDRASEDSGAPRQVVSDRGGFYLDVRSGSFVVLPFPLLRGGQKRV